MAQKAKQSFTLDDLLSGGQTFWNHQPEYMFTTWWGDRAVRLSVDEAVELTTKGETTLFTAKELSTAIEPTVVRTCTNATFPYPNDPIVLIQTGKTYLLINFEEHKLIWKAELPAEATEIAFNAKSRAVAYCIGPDVYILTANGNQVRVTNDGSDDIVNGHSVSREEFGIMSGLFWSPDGQRLAFYRKDQSRIPSYPQVDITSRIAKTYIDKYPMAGCESEDVSVGVYDICLGTTIWLQNPKPKTDYMTNISWAPDNRHIYVFELNRDQNHMQLFGYDATTGAKDAEPILEERHPKYVEPMNPLVFLPWDSSKAIMQSRRDNYNHLYLIDFSNKKYGDWHTAEGGGTTRDCRAVGLLTPGNFEIRDFIGLNQKQHSALFIGNVTHPLRATIHSVSIPSKLQKTTNSSKIISIDDGVHTTQISASGTYIIDTYSSPTVTRKINIIETANGKSRNLLTSSDPWANFEVPEITSGSIKAADGKTDLYYRLIKPVGFDPTKKYPTVVYVYGGPHAHNVQASRGYYFRGWEIYMAQKGYVIFVLDNRGSQYRGLKFEQTTFRHLGDEEMRDQMCGVEFLRSLPYVDTERLGVHGWSFGGFMTTNLMCTYPDVFKVGVAGGPVVDWKYYEVMYGERYMDRPEENPEGYESSGLIPKAKNLKGRLQIILGYNDPTCVPQHTLSFIRACINAGTQPDLFLYPGDGHNMFGTDQVHLHERITRYFDDYLK